MKNQEDLHIIANLLLENTSANTDKMSSLLPEVVAFLQDQWKKQDVFQNETIEVLLNQLQTWKENHQETKTTLQDQHHVMVRMAETQTQASYTLTEMATTQNVTLSTLSQMSSTQIETLDRLTQSRETETRTSTSVHGFYGRNANTRFNYFDRDG